MVLDKTDAAAALADIAASQARATQRYSYALSAPYVFLTGALWFVADMLMQFSTLDQRYIWPVCSGVATLFYIAISVVQMRGRTRGAAKPDKIFWRAGAVWLLIFGFMLGTFVIFFPFSGVQTHSFIGLFFGVLYAVLGLWMGQRIFILGAALAILSMVGFYEVHQYYCAYMAIVGGGALMLGAYWLRRA
jgi:hypothetical protein